MEIKKIDVLELEKNYEPESVFSHRYVIPEKLHQFLLKNHQNEIIQIGNSILNKPIFKISVGSGKKNVLLWSQMHGNETSGTLGLLDLLKFLTSEHDLVSMILDEFTLDIVPMLNPDGAEVWTRRNIMNIDINRDFLAEASVEIRILKDLISQKEYDLAYNLHDQRTIFGVGETGEPATLAFLSPSVSEDRELTETRQKSMGLIANIFNEISQVIPGKISRYSDEFYPRSAGDNFQRLGIPTLLFEGGHYPDDYSRQKVRQYFTLALITSLYYAAVKSDWKEGYEKYLTIPDNSVSYYDIIYRNVNLSENGNSKVDLAIQYTEKIVPGEEEISFIAQVEEIGDLSFMKGHREIDAKGRNFLAKNYKFPVIGMNADFYLDEWQILNGKKLEQFV